MNPRSIFLLPALLALSLVLPLHAQQAVVLQQQMDAETFHKTGLDTLSPDQLQHLQHWLAAHAGEMANPASTSGTQAAATAGNKREASGWFGHKQEVVDREYRTVKDAVAGPFRGWQTGSIITLQNGQKWRVVDGSLVVPRPMEHAEAIVKPAFAGSWLLKVKGYNSSARVEPAN